ncbi:MAG: glycosyltransferase family 4 protein [Alphaproteobacteria bacterium]|nr:glycosyltransferase family 4 protein [Alphaproteobacteria bacterium]
MATVGWLVGAPVPASGGQATVYALARALERAGHRCTFHLPRLAADDLPSIADRLMRWYGVPAERVFAGPASAAGRDVVIATDWSGLDPASQIGAKRVMQFAQDQEAAFRQAGDATLLLEAAPCCGATTIALGRWLAAAFADRYGRRPFVCDFGVDRDIYRPGDDARDDAVAFILQPGKHRRCPATGLAALAIVKRRRPRTIVRLFGDDRPPDVEFAAEALGRLDRPALGRLYRRSRVGLCLSATNPSRIPFEMMACGLPVVELYRANTLLDLPEDGALLAFQTPESIAEAILHLLDRPAASGELGRRAAAFMDARGSAVEDAGFVAAFESALRGEDPPATQRPPLYRRAPVVAPAQRNPATGAFLGRQRAEAGRLAARM